MASRKVYHTAIEDVARRSGKKISAVFKAVGDLKAATRQINPWNAFQVKYRAENPKPADGECLPSFLRLVTGKC